MTVAKLQLLDDFAQAWNRHDIEGLMRCMTLDCVFEASFGSAACGSLFVGAQQVRAGFAHAWQNCFDARWSNARHFVTGDRGVSEWTFTGTCGADNASIEVNGCDLFCFREDLIQIKNSYRKLRS